MVEQDSRTNFYEHVDLALVLRLLWRKRIAICGITFCIVLMGVAYAFLATPVYVANAIVAPKEKKNGVGGLSAQFGAFSSLGIQMGSTDVDRLEQIARSRDLATVVVRENNLLPQLFPKHWDAATKRWKAGVKAPTLQDGVSRLRREILVVMLNSKKGIITLEASTSDAQFSAYILKIYLNALNEKIRESIKVDAEVNRAYLEDQLDRTHDPLLREKIQDLISVELERAMLVNSSSFDIIESPVTPHLRDRPKRKQIVALSFISGVFISIVLVLSWKGMKTQAARILREGA